MLLGNARVFLCRAPSRAISTLRLHNSVRAAFPTTDLNPLSTITRTMASNGLSGLDRKAMEEERLARSRKRQRPISPPPVRNSAKAAKIEETPVQLPSGARLNFLCTAIQDTQASQKPGPASDTINRMKKKIKAEPDDDSDSKVKTEALPPGSLKYPRGVIKKTWAFGHERTGHDIKLEEVLEPSSVRTAVLSAFQWDVHWVLNKLKTPLNGGSTKCIFVMQGKEKADRDTWRDDASEMSHFLRLCFPNMSGLINCMHSKLMLLFHPSKLRIAIPTANLLNFDWGETGQMENSVFLIDLPRLPNHAKTTTEDLPPFGRELMYFIEKQGLDQDVRNGVLGFDFEATKDMAFVHTVGGMHSGGDAARTGLLGLSHAVRELGLASSGDMEIDFAASSIGMLNESQVEDLHSAAQGLDLIAEAKAKRSKAGADFFKKKQKSASDSSLARSKVRIYFPMADTVRASTAGAAGSICLQRKHFEGKNFPRDIFRDYKSTRQGLLSHNKILCARSKDVAWVYVGSANMSKSAWGELGAKRDENKITCRNWECGVILPVQRNSVKAEKQRDENGDCETEDEDDNDNTNSQQLVGIEAFHGVVDLPFEIPGEEFRGREPWYFTE